MQRDTHHPQLGTVFFDKTPQYPYEPDNSSAHPLPAITVLAVISALPLHALSFSLHSRELLLWRNQLFYSASFD